MIKKTIAVLFSIFLFFGAAVAQEVTSDFSYLEGEISELDEQLKKIPPEKSLSLLKNKAKYLECANMFPEAEETYFKCAEVAPSNEKFVYILKAVKCCLCYGNAERADELLAKIASEARNNEYAPTFKLYAVWSWLAKCTSYSEAYEPLAILKSYLELPAMKSVRPQIMFTLWYVSAEKKYADMLKSEYPNSMETAIVNGKAELSPSPYWFFLCRKN